MIIFSVVNGLILVFNKYLLKEWISGIKIIYKMYIFNIYYNCIIKI